MRPTAAADGPSVTWMRNVWCSGQATTHENKDSACHKGDYGHDREDGDVADGISSAFTGNGGLNLFANTKERGSEKVISNLTLVLGIAFFALVI